MDYSWPLKELSVMKRLKTMFAALAAACAMLPHATGCVSAHTVTDVIDGDTVKIVYEGEIRSVRLLNIDAPERGADGYGQAREALKLIIGGRGVRLEWKNDEPATDVFGRLLAYVWVEDSDGREICANIEMVRLGHSEYWTKYGNGRHKRLFEEAEGSGNCHQ